MKRLKIVLWLMACQMAWSMNAVAQEVDDDSVYVEPPVEILTLEGKDSLFVDSIRPVREILTSKIHLLTRCYNDRVVLRWFPEDYVSYLFLATRGVNVLRVKSGSFDIDTLAYALKPLTEEQMRAKYEVNDSNAMVAMGLLYGEGRKGEGQTEDKPGSLGAGMELNSEQDISFGFAMLVAEWRPDLAVDLAVGFEDRTAVRDSVYDYYIQPTVWDNGGRIIFEPGVAEGVKVVTYKPEPYDLEITDTLSSPQRFILSWTDPLHSSFEIDRREVTDPQKNTVGPWERINDKPYVSMAQTDFEGLSLLSDSVYKNGTWEYRIMAHDPFGELTEPSPIHRAYARDIKGPIAPQLKVVYLDRPEKDPMARIMARVVWQNPEVQDSDCKGYLLKYYNEELYDGWHLLTDDYIPITDTLITIDVTGLRTGLFSLSAYDEMGNETPSLAKLVHITDFKAPEPPDSLRCMVLDEGYAILTWKPSEEDDIAYYDLAYANDLTHEFLRLNQKGIVESGYVDTLALDVNQKYIYYKVRAVDYSNNVGQWSPYLQVMRPHNTPPTQPHLDKSSHDDKNGMHMRWIVGKDADMDFHILWRRVGEEGEWQCMRRWDADSLANIGNWALEVDDNPAHNRRERYYYMVESFNSSPFTSQSLAVSWQHSGPKYFDIPVRLSGDWVKLEEGGQGVRLTWECGELPAALKEAPYYYCVFRKKEGDKRFRYVTNVASTDVEFTDSSLSTGESAQYYILIHFEDGRESQQSNAVTVQRK